MKSISCKLFCSSNTEHLSQIYTGFGLLVNRGLIDVKYLRNDEYKANGKQLLLAIVNNAHTLVYDTADHDRIYNDALSKCDFYFKRSYRTSTHGKMSKKIRPLGLNYPVFGGSDGSMKRAFWAFREDGTSSLKSKARNLIDSNRFLSGILSDKNSGRNILDSRSFEGFPRHQKEPPVLFLARAWDPQEIKNLSAERIAERHYINNMRASCIRGLRKEFGHSFLGGFAASTFAQAYYPDCVVDVRVTQKSKYLLAVRKAGICIATMGLDKSNGWKLAEYIANAKAIVTEELHFEVTGNFEVGRNYLAFQSAEQCVEGAVRLYEHPDQCYRMRMNNYAYYHQYLRPDILVWNTLQHLEEATQQ
jgi:hypothetical protein